MDVDQCYEVLELEPGASWEQVRQAYRDLAYVWHPDRYPDSRPLLKRKAEDKLKAINAAYEYLRTYIRCTASAAVQSGTGSHSSSSRTSTERGTPTGSQSHADPRRSQGSHWDPGYLQQARLGQENAIRTLIAVELASQGIKAQVNFRLGALRVCVEGQRYPEPESVARILTTLLNQLRIRHIQKATLMGTSSSGEVIWSRHLLMPALPRQRLSVWLTFDQLEINTLAFPIALVLAALLGQMGVGDWGLLAPLGWIRDLGHLVLSWFASRVFGGVATDVPLQIPARSFWVYGVTLVLLGRWCALAWQGRWLGQLSTAGGLVLIQFWLTFLISEADYALMAAWSGVGSELILGMVLMIGFHIRLPFWWRWRAWRYPALLLGAYLFWQGFERWHGLGVYWGLDWPVVLAGRSVPTQSVERLLAGFGWNPYHIIQALAHLSHLCGVVLIGAYVYGLARSRGMQRWRWDLWEWKRWLRRFRIRLR